MFYKEVNLFPSNSTLFIVSFIFILFYFLIQIFILFYFLFYFLIQIFILFF